jgi:mono/diheme cytochrome c family protein
MKVIIKLFLVIGLFTIVSCGNNKQNSKPDYDLTGVDLEKGKEIYNQKCIICHMPAGEGVQGAFPPIAKSDYLLEDKTRAVNIVFHGSHIKMIVNGVEYNDAMPPQELSKQEAVDVTNFILNSFGNQGGVVTIDDISDDFTLQ